MGNLGIVAEPTLPGQFCPSPGLTLPRTRLRGIPDATASSFRSDFPSASVPVKGEGLAVALPAEGSRKLLLLTVLTMLRSGAGGRSQVPPALGVLRPHLPVCMAQQKGQALAKAQRRPGRVGCGGLVWTPSGLQLLAATWARSS